MTNSMRFTLACGALSLLSASAGAYSAGYTDAGVHYTISIPADGHRTAEVSASLTLDGAEFTMFPGANQLPARWSTFVSDFKVKDNEGREIPVTANADGTWRLSGSPAGRVDLSYTVRLDHEDHQWSGGVDGAAYWREWGVFYTARSLFVINGEERKNLTVAFNLPEQWQVTAPWEKLAGDIPQYRVASHGVLGASMLFAGTHKEVVVQQGPFEFLLALGGQNVLEREDMFVELAGGVLDYYVELMGDVPRLIGDAAAGKPVVIINQSEMTDGEAIGNNISILLGPTDDPMSQQIAAMLFAHEFFHLWNGKSFFPTSEESEWFKEGFSNLYTLKALQHIGFLNDESFLGVLGGFFYQRYAQDDAVGRLSITDGHQKHDHWGLIYSGGMLVAIAQDLQIRSATGNEKSLDDLMRFMFNEYDTEAYEIAAIEEKLGELSGSSQESFFARYVYGVERIPIADFFEIAGIETIEENGHTSFRAREISDPETTKVQRGFFGAE